jgi:hypothetical protein
MKMAAFNMVDKKAVYVVQEFECCCRPLLQNKVAILSEIRCSAAFIAEILFSGPCGVGNTLLSKLN